MPLNVSATAAGDSPFDLRGKCVFLSASIPDPERWRGDFDPLEITDAVVATIRTILTSGGRVVTAAHPTIAPLILYVAREIRESIAERPAAIIYQSRLFVDVLPSETSLLAEAGLADVRWTEAQPGETRQPSRRRDSLKVLREVMLGETQPVAAIFIGGMKGILDEFYIYRRLFPDRPSYAIGQPGGEASSLVEYARQELRNDLATSRVYPALLQRVLADIVSTLEQE